MIVYFTNSVIVRISVFRTRRKRVMSQLHVEVHLLPSSLVLARFRYVPVRTILEFRQEHFVNFHQSDDEASSHKVEVCALPEYT
jgi:hypothetical protein